MVLRGRLAPEVGALVQRALAAARETLYQRSRRETIAEPLIEPPTDSTVDTLTHTGTDRSIEPLNNRARTWATDADDEPLIEPSVDPSLEAPTYVQQQADALALLAETALRHELDPGAPGERYQVVVHVRDDIDS